MAATVEVKFFNSFLLKKTISQGNDPLWNGSTGIPSGTAGSFPQIKIKVTILKRLESEVVTTIQTFPTVLELT